MRRAVIKRIVWALRVPALVLVLLFLLICTSAPRVFTVLPTAAARWVVPVQPRRLGDAFDVALEITAPMGVVIDTESLPREGEALGPFRIRRRTVSVANTSTGQVVTVCYTLQYLSAMQQGVFTVYSLPSVRVGYEYYRFLEYFPRIPHHFDGETQAHGARVYLLRRVYPGDKPFPLVGEVAEPPARSVISKIAGGAVLSGLLLFYLGKAVTAFLMRRRRKQLELVELARPRFELQALWERWVETGEYILFLRAAVIARDLEKRQLGLPPGGLLPRLELWLVTTVALYSGRELSPARTRRAFELFLERFPVTEAEENED